MGLWSHFSFLLLTLTAFVLAIGPKPVRAGDADILLQWQSGFRDNYTFPGWTQENIPNLCTSWLGIECNNQSRVERLRLRQDDNPQLGVPVPPVTTVSPVLAQLGELSVISFSGMDFYGVLPPQILQLPKMGSLVLKNTPLTIQIPATVSPVFNQLILDGVNFTGPIPDVFPWSRMSSLEFKKTEVRCPLPQGLLNQWKVSTSPKLRAPYSLLDAVDNTLCGQIAMTDVMGSPHPGVYGARSSTNVLKFSAVHRKIQLDFYDHEVKVYGLLYNGSVWRDDYFSLNIPPLQPFDSNVYVTPRSYNITAFESIQWTVPNKTLEATATLRNYLNEVVLTRLIFQFDVDDGNININGATIKFSYSARYINVTTPHSRVHFGMVARYHTQHSVPGEAPLYCGQFTGQPLACQGQVANMTFALFGDLSTRIAIVNNRVAVSFSYGFAGIRDGAKLFEASGANKTEVDAARYFEHIGHVDITDPYQAFGMSDHLPRAGAAKDQAVILVVIVDVARFAELFYDPDISMSLLFDTPPAPISTSIEAVGSNEVAIASGVTVTVVVVLSAVGGFVLWRRRQSAENAARETIARRLNESTADRSNTADNATVHAPAPQETPKKAGWRKSSLSGIRATNIADN